MRQEVAPKVLAIIDQYLRDHGKQNIYDVLQRLGVRDANSQATKIEYAWEVPTGAPIFTIWAEGVCVHPLSGGMFSVENMKERNTLINGDLMNPGQRRRTNERRRLMRQVLGGQPFIAVLQTDVRSRAELMQGISAKPDLRIKDSPWHVAHWDAAKQRAILVRGEPGWCPSEAEVDQYLVHGHIVSPDQPGFPEAPPREEKNSGVPTLTFPDQAHRDLVEARSMATMMQFFVGESLFPVDVSNDNLGYDIDVRNADGVSVFHVEVKGTASSEPGFFLTRNEWATAGVDDLWELALVTNALSACHIERYAAWEVKKRFRFDELVWRCELKARAD